MKWHTDKPIPSLAAAKPVLPVLPVNIDRISGPARLSYSKARAYFRKKLRARLRTRGRTDSADQQD